MKRIKSNVIFNSRFRAALSLILAVCFLISSGGAELFAQQRGTISIDSAVALPLTTAEGNQVKVIVNYSIDDESLIGQKINAIMGIYDRNNGSLVKLSSFPNGFVINNTEGTTQLATSLLDPKIQNISAIVTLTNAEKSEKYTNDVRADLNVRSILPSSLEDMPQTGIQTGTPEIPNTSSSDESAQIEDNEDEEQ
jgi:hypothetical protein